MALVLGKKQIQFECIGYDLKVAWSEDRKDGRPILRVVPGLLCLSATFRRAMIS